MKKRYSFLAVAALSLPLVLSNCKKPEPEKPPVFVPGDEQLYVLNEGTFNFGTAGLGLWNLTKKQYNDLFEAKNNRPLGDVAQSAVIHGSELFLVINNSGKIEILNKTDGASVGAITGLRSPRYMTFLSDNKAYVTDLYDNAIAIVNPAERKLTGKIPFYGWGEGMCQLNNQVFVCNLNRNYLYQLDPSKDQVTDSVKTNMNAYQVFADRNGMLWTLCQGDPPTTPASIYRIHPTTLAADSFVFPGSAKPSAFAINPDKDRVYWAESKQVYSMAVGDNSLPSSAISGVPARNWYQLQFINSNDLYLFDPLDFVQNGNILRYSIKDQAITDSIKAGIIPRQVIAF